MIRSVETPWGPMQVDDLDIYVGQSILVYGEFSPDERRLLEVLVKPGDVVLDIGANIGALTLPLAAAAGATGHVYAFEPQPAVAHLLTLNVMHRRNSTAPITVYQQAVGAAPGTIRIPPRPADAPADALRNDGGLELGGAMGEEVAVVTVDSLHLGQCNLIKADVEGMEADVLEGARETIARCRPLLYLEVDREAKRPHLLALLQELGYRWHFDAPPLFSPNNHRGVRFPTAQLVGTGGLIVSLNCLAIPNERPLLAWEAGEAAA